MALNEDPFVFSDEVKRRLGNWDEVVVRDGVTEDSDPLDTGLIYSPVDPFGPQAVPIPGTKRPGYSEVYRNVTSTDKVISTWHPSVRTYYDALENAFNGFAGREFLGQRFWDPFTKTWSGYKFETFHQVSVRRDNFASGLTHVVNKHTGLDPLDSKYVVANYGPNSVNWVIADFACLSQSLPTVCLYDTLGPNTSKYILELTRSPVVVASVANIPKLLQIKPDLPELKVIICFSSLQAEYDSERPDESMKELFRTWAQGLGVHVYDFDEIETIGKETSRPHNPPKREDIYTINFTSGTTGNPKGVILTHTNIVAVCVGPKCRTTPIDARKQDTSYSCLPLAHMAERMSMLVNSCAGNRIAFPHGSLTEIFSDIIVLQPTTCTLVPRILNRVATQVKAATIEAPGQYGELCRRALAEKLEILKKTGQVTHPKWDRLIAERARQMFGFTNMRQLTTGAAPLSPDTYDFLRVVFALDLLQGYGMTESTSGMCASLTGDPEPGSVGPTSPSCEVRLRDLPELGYTSDDQANPRGEIMLRGPQIFRGYFKENQKTLEGFDEEGWFHSGDVGRLDSQGRIYIIDRVKHFFKLSQGEYIAPEKIENVYMSRNTILSQIFVHGSPHENFLVAIVGVNPEVYSQFVSEVTGKVISPEQLADMAQTFSDAAVRKKVLAAINGAIEEGVLNGFEKIRNIKLFIEPLRLEDGTVTPTLKIKRNHASTFYDSHIQEMYKEGKLELDDATSKL